MRKTSTSYLLLFTFLLLAGGAFSQGDRATVLLRNGSVNPTENLQELLASQPLPTEIVNGQYFRLLQFQQIPTEQEKQRMAAAGIDLITYYPYNTWLAAIPATINPQVFAEVGVRSAFTMPVEAKLHDFLLTQNYPDYVWEGDYLQLIIQIPSNLSPTYITGLLNAQGIETGEILPGGDQFFAKALPGRIESIANLPYILWIEGLPDPGEPEDFNALSLHRSGAIASDHPLGRKYNGEGVNIMVRDDGGIGPHIDFQGRTNQVSTGGPGGGTHGDGVAGVFSSAGNLNPINRGAAWGSFIYVLNYQSTFTDNTLLLHQTDGVMITNSSYSNGCNAGYTTTTQRVDFQTTSNPSLLHVFSAGNSNNNNCNYGAGNQWGNITGGHKQGKNVIAVANLFADGSLVASSSRGPAHDGRIKPDVAAHGQNQISNDPFNTYQSFGGTSAAAPSTAGVIAQLYHAYKELGNGTNPPSALIKAILMNSAEDYGNRGPDFKYGWGRINGLRAVKTLEEDRYFSATVANGASNTHTIEVLPGVVSLKVMTYWLDPAATPGASIALVNDLDTDISGPSGNHLPWLPNPTPNTITLDVPAMKGADHLNNVEQVQIDNPQVGTHTLTVNGFSVPQGPQEYYVVIEYITEEIEVVHPMGGEGFGPGESARIEWDAHGNFGPFTLHYSTDGGNSWNLIASNVSGGVRLYEWAVPNEVGGNARVRVSRGNVSDDSDHEFSIIGIPTGLEIVSLCTDKMTLKWDPVPGVSGYDVFLLGTTYMDSVGSTTETTFTFDIPSPFVENWVSVRARTQDDKPGRRATSITNSQGPITCTNGADLRVTDMPSIGGGQIPSCADTVRVSVEVMNGGTTAQSGFTIGYQITGEPMVTQVITDTLAPNQIMTYTFDGGFSPTFGVGLTLPIKGFVGAVVDVAPANDTLYENLEISNNPLLNPPFVEAFEGFGFCSTATNCGNTICPLGQGWVNETNGVADDIDWRVNSGTTVSNNTGPSVDHNPGTSVGKYAYLESSNGCEQQEAILTSPCIFLGQISEPVISFWYHMYGGNMGSLHVDIFNGEKWTTNVAVVSGDQGDVWKNLQVKVEDLTGTFFTFRIRGITGGGFTSDMAIDNISVFDAAQPPVAAFSATRLEVCPGDEITFVDESEFAPTTYEWDFSPNNVSFLGGTSASTASPILSFTNVGEYDVTLKVSNSYGADTIAKTIYISASHGATLPIMEDFESGTFPPAKWNVDNPDDSFTWEFNTTSGVDGNITSVARLNHYQYTTVGAEDLLTSMNVDLRTAISPTLSFDLAYANRTAQHFDELTVVISDNCGQSYLFPVYQKAQSDLQTATPSVAVFFPSSPSDWRRDSIDLTPFVGQTISVGFVALNGAGNNLHIDNIEIADAVTVAPEAFSLANLTEICAGEPLMLSDSSKGNNLTYLWELGPGSAPGSHPFGGPFTVSYNTPGIKTIILTVSNSAGTSSDTLQVLVNPVAEAAFTFGINGGFQTYTFDNSSTDATSYAWDFGDGTTSTDSIPTHTYTQNGAYTVRLIATGICGPDTVESIVLIDNVSIEGMLGGLLLKAYPNPVEDVLLVEVEGQESTTLTVSLADIRGRTIETSEWKVNQGTSKKELNVSELPEGIYVLKVQGEAGQFIRRVVVR